MIEIIILDYIDDLEEEATAYVHTKDKRILAVHDVRSNPIIDKHTVYIDFIQWGKRMTFALPREDFSHIEYCYKNRKNTNEFIDEEQIYPPDLLTEASESLFEDLI